VKIRANPYSVEYREEHADSQRSLAENGLNSQAVGFHHWRYFSKK
jgi:hypothetical protein